MDKPIPEDLKDQYNRIANSLRSDWRWALPLFERIGHLEQTVASQRKLLDKYDAANTKLLHENAKYYLNGRNEYYNRMKHEQRVNASLRGVITRMKRKERDSIRHD
jgi:hypothetical protein